MKNIFVCLLLVGCEFPSYSIKEDDRCIKPGDTYVQAFDKVYGDCPQIPPVLVTINEDGSLPVSEYETCSSVKTEECRTKNAGCLYVKDDCQIKSSISLIVHPEDESGYGNLEVEMTCGSDSCLGIYQIFYSKQ